MTLRNEREANEALQRFTMKRLTPLARRRLNYTPAPRPSRHWLARLLRWIWGRT